MPIIPPILLVSREVKEKAPIPKKVGKYPPTIDPTSTQIVTQAFVDIPDLV
jgi:hypothetical protein